MHIVNKCVGMVLSFTTGGGMDRRTILALADSRMRQSWTHRYHSSENCVCRILIVGNWKIVCMEWYDILLARKGKWQGVDVPAVKHDYCYMITCSLFLVPKQTTADGIYSCLKDRSDFTTVEIGGQDCRCRTHRRSTRESRSFAGMSAREGSEA